MKQKNQSAPAAKHPGSRFNYLKENSFFSIYRGRQGKTRSASSKHEYSDKGLSANELNQAYFFLRFKM
jgi:hypothetical protein